MPISFQPKEESELSKGFAPLPPGTYPFTVLESEEVASKSVKNAGKMMVKVKLNVHGPTSDVHVYDYFADWFSEWKLKHFCETVGLGENYLAGILDATANAWEGRSGSVTLSIGEPTEKYPKPKNEVDDYVPREKKTPSADTDLEKDDVPF